MKTSEIFEEEINYIKSDVLKEIVKEVLDKSPECIQVIPASSSGRFHPSADLGEGGLNRHVKAVVGIANCLIGCDIFKEFVFGIEANVNQELINMYADVAYASLILHDCMKPDDSPKHSTKFDHPILASELFVETSKDYIRYSPFINKSELEYLKTVIPIIKGCIASHMGQFNTAVYAKGIVLPKPSNNIELFVHMCDYIASRKYLDFNFDKYYTKK